MEELTEKQERVFAYIRDEFKQSGSTPTIREIADFMGFRSPNGAVGHLVALERKGHITRGENKSRSIRLVKPRKSNHSDAQSLPLVGRVAAGAMTEAVEQSERIHFGKIFQKGDFVLEVQGDSMIDAHIESGDYVVVKKQRVADRGDIVVVRDDDDEATLKYWFPEKGRVRLQPANKKMKAIYRRDVQVVGVVVGVVRKF
jgi:repressor LexA